MTVNGQIPTVGTRIVVEGSEEAAKNQERVTKAQQANTEAVNAQANAYGPAQKIQDEYFARQAESAQTTVKVTELTDKELAAKEKLWAANEKLFQSLKEQQGFQVNQQRQQEAEIESIRERARLIVESGIAFGASTAEMSASLQKLGFNAKETQEILRNFGIEVEQSGNKISSSAIASSRAFFALTLASFGLMEITRQLKEANSDLAPTFDKFTSVFQAVASFGSAGVFLGSAFGPGGAVIGGGIGGSIGLLSQLPVLLDQTTEGTKALIESMVKLGQEDDASKTLSELADITREQADAALDAAKNNDILKEAITKVAEAKKAQENVLPDPFTEVGARALFGDAIFEDEVTRRRRIADANLELAQSYVQVVIAQDEATASGEKLRAEYDKLATKLQTEDDLFQRITGLTKDQTSEITSYTEAHKNAGDALASTIRQLGELEEKRQQDLEHSQLYTDEAGRLGKVATDQAHSLFLAAEAEKVHGDEADKAAAAQKRYADAIEQSNHSLEQLATKTANQYAQAQQTYDNAVQDSAEQRQNSIFNAEQNLTDRIADLWQDLQNKLVDINQQLADKVYDINTQLANKLSDIQSQLSDKYADIQSQLADKISGIQQDLANKLAALAHQRDQDVASANLKIEQAARDLARKLWEIERDRIQATNALDFNTGEQLRLAKTEHDRQDILRRHQFEQGQIDQNANDAKRDAELDFADKVAQANKERQLAKSTYDYQVMLAKQLAQQKIDEAEREASQARAIAQREANQQTAIAQRQSQQQLAIAQREAAQQLALAERRYEEEKATAVRTYNEQVLAARRAEEQKLADAARALQQRNALIAQSYALERAEIIRTLNLALDAFRLIIEAINLANTHLMGFANAYQNFIDDPLGLKGLNDSLIPTPALPNIGGYGGMDMDVPAGHPNDTFMIGARTGEHVNITPPGMSTSTSNKSMVFNIYGAINPAAVRNEIASYLSDEAWR